MPEADASSGTDPSSSSEARGSDRASEAQDSLSDKSRDALSGNDTAVDDPEVEVTPEQQSASQEKMAAEQGPAKDRVQREMTNAEALDQEVAALNAVAAGKTLSDTHPNVEVAQETLGFEIAPEAVVTQAAYEIAPSGNIFGKEYGVVTAGRDGFGTEQEAVESFREVVDWYRSGEGAREYELGTTIYEAADGTFGHNDIVTFYSRDSVSPFLDVPDGARVVGVAHSHPEPNAFNQFFGYDGETFSDTDIAAQERMQRQFDDDFSLYMVSPTNQLNVYPPEQ